MASVDPASSDATIARVKMLVNNQLKQILKKEGLPVSGAKATLQTRIIDQLRRYAQGNNLESFSHLRHLVFHPDANATATGLSPSPAAARAHPNNPPHLPSQYQHSFSSSSVRPGAPGITTNMNGSGPRAPQFKSSPFYTVVEPLTPVLECKVRETTRDNVEAQINLRSDVAEKLATDSSTRVMIYCGADPMSPFSRVDIEFPYQVEIKINQDEVKANLRGLKNKPGTTRPADITTLLRARAGYRNEMVLTYALTKKKYLMVVNLVKLHPVEDLVSKLKSGKTISKEQVIREMISRADDADIVATSSIMSLKCPLSTLRIDIPCRSSICSHNQCFDATSFLQLQEQAPTWTCPVCNKAVAYEHLQVDQYVDNILQSTPKSVDQVTIEPDGKWFHTSGSAPSPPRTNGRTSSDGEEDLVEIRDMPRLASVKTEFNREPGLMGTPPISSREQSTSSAAPPNQSSNKRSVGQVVDLTLSSDEDDEPSRPAKRLLVHKSSSGIPKFSGLEDVPLRQNGVNSGAPRSQSSNPFATLTYLPKDYGHAS
ncbi:hypothetical protein N7G274_010306 [Stereocaulon virgatum]|uniref:Uncharacterized protein n=1 Tax=Stereocaulon virgatum TaxID=373712 RepID=A0ABR3ZWB2_9LECA